MTATAVTPEDWEHIRANRPDWRVADVHDLRTRFARVLGEISEHRRHTLEIVADDEEVQVSAADYALWKALEREGWNGFRF